MLHVERGTQLSRLSVEEYVPSKTVMPPDVVAVVEALHTSQIVSRTASPVTTEPDPTLHKECIAQSSKSTVDLNCPPPHATQVASLNAVPLMSMPSPTEHGVNGVHGARSSVAEK
jgi:hypothetical protein